MTSAIDKAADLAKYIAAINETMFSNPERTPLRVTTKTGTGDATVSVTRLASIPGDAVLFILNKAIDLGSKDCGVKTTTGELYAIFNA